MSSLLVTLAQQSTDQQGGGSGMEQLLIMLPALALIFYFLLIRPQRQKEKQRREMLEKVKKGDSIITTGGILGEVVRTSERELVVLVDKEKNVRLRMVRSAIYGIVGAEEGEGEAPEKGSTEGGYKK